MRETAEDMNDIGEVLKKDADLWSALDCLPEAIDENERLTLMVETRDRLRELHPKFHALIKALDDKINEQVENQRDPDEPDFV